MQNGIPQIVSKGCVQPYLFTASDLVNGKKRFIHNWNTDPRSIVIHAYTDEGLAFSPDIDGGSDFNSIMIDFSGLQVTNTWKVILISDGDYTRVTDTIPFGICQTYISGSSSDWKAGQTNELSSLTSIHVLPADGDMIALYYNNAWSVYPFANTALAVSGLSVGVYDVFSYWTGTQVAFEPTAWGTFAFGTDHRITPLTRRNGILVKTGDPSRRYIGSFEWSGTATFDTNQQRWIDNYYNKLDKIFYGADTVTHNYPTTTWRRSPNFGDVYLLCGVPSILNIELGASITNGYVNICWNGSASAWGTNLYTLYSATQHDHLHRSFVGLNYFYTTEYGTSSSTFTWSLLTGVHKC